VRKKRIVEKPFYRRLIDLLDWLIGATAEAKQQRQNYPMAPHDDPRSFPARAYQDRSIGHSM
jgi:hypothetical protein